MKRTKIHMTAIMILGLISIFSLIFSICFIHNPNSSFCMLPTIVNILFTLSLCTNFILIHKKGVSRKELERIAFEDPITQGITYEKFILEAKYLICKTNRNYAILSMNIDKFKYINDIYGYNEGNSALRNIYDCTLKCLKQDELLSRVQSDYYLVLLHYQTRNDLLKRLHELYDCTNFSTHNNGKHYDLKLYMGVYEINDKSLTIETMIDKANVSQRKTVGLTDQFYNFYDEKIRKEMIRKNKIEINFHKALHSHQLVPYFQPKYNIKTSIFDGAEALVRWIKRDGTIVPPGDFLPILEKNGSILELDKYIFRAVCEKISQWLLLGYNVSPISVNISRLHLYNPKFIDEYLQIIEEFNIPPDLIQIELTETILFDNETVLHNILKTFQNYGIKILMDDFGSGYSSIYMLKTVPIDILKIDKNLIDDLNNNIKAQNIIKSIISLAHQLSIEVTAEGVETKEQFDFLIEANCDYIQGYYCSMPLALREYENMIQNKLCPLSSY